MRDNLKGILDTEKGNRVLRMEINMKDNILKESRQKEFSFNALQIKQLK